MQDELALNLVQSRLCAELIVKADKISNILL